MISALCQMLEWRENPWTVVPPLYWGKSAVSSDPDMSRKWDAASQAAFSAIVHVRVVHQLSVSAGRKCCIAMQWSIDPHDHKRLQHSFGEGITVARPRFGESVFLRSRSYTFCECLQHIQEHASATSYGSCTEVWSAVYAEIWRVVVAPVW